MLLYAAHWPQLLVRDSWQPWVGGGLKERVEFPGAHGLLGASEASASTWGCSGFQVGCSDSFR